MKNDEGALKDGLEKLTDILTGAAKELEDLAESYETGYEEITVLLVNALDGISSILNGATNKVKKIASELPDGNDKN